MTVVEIAVDLIRERDQLKKRIRELEKESESWEVLTANNQNRIEQLEQRIAKAREILQTILSLGDWEDVKRALEALEGK